MITAVFANNSDAADATGLWQYDYGQVLRIQGLSLTKTVKIDFSLSETGSESVPRVGVTKDGVTDVPIPDSMLENGGATMDYDIYAFVYLEDETSGKTTHRITMPVTSRPKPQAFDAPEDAQLFRDAIAAVNESAGRAETSEKLAEAWAHGREDYPEREEDNSKYYAGVAEEKAGAANDAMEQAQRLADQVNMNADAVNQDVIRSKEYLEQTTKSAAEALQSEQAAKSSETAAQEAQAGAEAAEMQAELHALDAAASASGAELAKTQAQENAQQASEDREAVQKLSDGFSTACEKAVRDIHTAGENQVNAVDKAGQKALENIGTGIDNTLTHDGKAADAGATGRAIDDLKGDLGDITVRRKSSNLFNQDTITDGIVFNPKGVLIAESNFITTDFIPVNSGEILYFSIKPRVGFTERYAYNIFRLFFFTAEKEIIAQAYDSVKSVVVPDGAYYVRVSVNKAGLNAQGVDQEFAINVGGIVEDFEHYYDYKSLKCDEVLSEESENPVRNKVVTVALNKGNDRIDEISVVEEPNNLFDPNAAEPGELKYGSSGTIDETLTDYITSGYINAKPGKIVYFSRQDYGETYRTAVKCYVCCYDDQKNPVTNRVDGVSNYEIPENAAFFRISVSNTSASADKLFAINYDEVKPYEVYSAPVRVSNDHDTVIDNDRYIKSFAKTARNTDYTKIVRTCTHVSRRPLVTIVADDGWADDYTLLKDMVDKVHEDYPNASIPCCISLQTNAIHYDGGMALEQALYSQNELGWEYACHVDGTNLENLATENEIEDLIVASLKLYDLYGLNVQNIVYCEGGNDERVRRIAKKYFNCGATTLPWYGGADTTSDNTGIIGSMYLKRHGLGIYPSGDGTFENDYKVAVDNAIAHNGWLIFMLHPNSAAHDETQQQYFIQTIKYCIEQGVDIVTLQQGYDIFGNVLECGDFLGSTSAHPEQGFAISKNGEFSKNPFI